MTNAQLAPPDGFQESVNTTGSSISEIDESCSNVMNMAIVSSQYAPTLQTDIENAKNVANEWTLSIRNQVISSLSGIVTYNDLYQSASTSLYAISEEFADDDYSDVDTFQEILGQLEEGTEQQQEAVEITQSNLTNYVVELDDTLRALNNDQEQLQNEANYLNSQMNSLNSEMNSIQKEIDDEESNIFSKLWYELTGQLGDLEDELKDVENSYNQASQQLYEVNNCMNTVQGYSNSVTQIQSGVNGLANGWESLNADLNMTLQAEDITDYNAFTPALVEAAASDWQTVADLAESFI